MEHALRQAGEQWQVRLLRAAREANECHHKIEQDGWLGGVPQHTHAPLLLISVVCVLPWFVFFSQKPSTRENRLGYTKFVQYHICACLLRGTKSAHQDVHVCESNIRTIETRHITTPSKHT